SVRRADGAATAVLRRRRATAADGHDGSAVLPDTGDAADVGSVGRTRADATRTLARLRADLAGAARVQRRCLLARPCRSARPRIVIPAMSARAKWGHSPRKLGP